MKVGSFWDESQVAIVDPMTASYQNGSWGFSAPALASSIIRQNVIVGVIFIEAVPGSEHWGEFVNPITLKKNPGNVVKVNVWQGADIKTIKQVRTDIWPLEWFGLKQLPPYTTTAFAAFDYAMGVV